VPLHGRQAEDQLARDLVVGRWRAGFVRGEGTAQGEQNAPLGLGDGRTGNGLDGKRRRDSWSGIAESEQSVTHLNHVAVAQRALPPYTATVDKRAVSGQAVVLDHPTSPTELKVSMDSRYAWVPCDFDLAARCAPQDRALAVEPDQELGSVVVAQEQERVRIARGLRQRPLFRGAHTEPQDRPLLRSHGIRLQPRGFGLKGALIRSDLSGRAIVGASITVPGGCRELSVGARSAGEVGANRY
jgi:hypothetical protein